MIKNFYTVGMAASNFGIKALKEFLSYLPDKPGAAFVVVVSHVIRELEIELSNVLSLSTKLPVEKVVRTTRVQPDRIYVMAENTCLTVRNGYVIVEERGVTDPQEVIDALFVSLGRDFREKAVGILFRAMGKDGVKGIRAIQQQDGLVMVQMPQEAGHAERQRISAKHDSPSIVGDTRFLSTVLMDHIQYEERRSSNDPA